MLEVKEVTKEYGGRITALSNVSFELEKGEMAFLARPERENQRF